MERNGIHIIDLKKTQEMIEAACNAVSKIVGENKKVLFVATKKPLREVVEAEAKRCGSFYVSERWLGGMLTNFSTIRKSVKRLNNLEKMENDGTFESITKKERLFLSRERDKLQKVLSGVADMSRLPGLLFVVDVKKETIAVKEANRLGIPVVAIVDTNCDPDLIGYPIPANDDALKSVQIIAKIIGDAVLEGTERAASQQALMAEQERAAAEKVGQEAKASLKERS